MGRKMKKVLFFIFVILFVLSLSGFSEVTETATSVLNREENFEDLNWQLLYPDVILEDAAAWIELTSGGFISEEGPSLFMEIEPGMHFLIFDGKFHVRLEQDNDPFGSFVRIKNSQVSDYFIDTTVRYKDLTFNFGLNERRNGQMVFYPRSDFNRKYVSFALDYDDWDLFIKSPEWTSWTFDVNTPGFNLGPVSLSLSADAFLDNSASLTAAVSAGPQIRFDKVSVLPFAGYEYSTRFPSVLQVEKGLEGRQQMVFGILSTFNTDIFRIDGGVKYSDRLCPFVDVQLGPLEMTYGKNLFLANEFRGIKEWTDVYWNYEADLLKTDIGFSYEKNHLEEVQFGLFADFEFNLLDTVILELSIKKTDEWLYEMGIQYNFKLDFYASTEEE